MTERLVGSYRAVGWHFGVRCADPVVADYVDGVLATLRTDDPAQEHFYDLAPAADGVRGRLHVDGSLLAEDDDDGTLCATLFWHVNRGVSNTGAEHVLLHASAAERDGAAVLMCAPSESGKTTLVTGLLRAGLRYITDETVAIRPDDGLITPYPKALSIDTGSWKLYPDLRPVEPRPAAPILGNQWNIPPTTFGPAAVSDGARPRVVLLPRYIPDQPVKLTPVGRAECLFALLQQTFRPTRNRERDMAVLADAVRGSDCYRLDCGDVDETVAAVLGALDAALSRSNG